MLGFIYSILDDEGQPLNEDPAIKEARNHLARVLLGQSFESIENVGTLEAFRLFERVIRLDERQKVVEFLSTVYPRGIHTHTEECYSGYMNPTFPYCGYPDD